MTHQPRPRPDRFEDHNFVGDPTRGWSCALYAVTRLGLLSWRPGDEDGARWECNCGERGQAHPPAAAAAELAAHCGVDDSAALDLALAWANGRSL